MTIGVAIVGCGRIADAHVEAIRAMPEAARVVAACDREALLAEQLAVRYAIPRHYDDLDTMIAAERPDVVHVTTPPASHVDIAVRAIDAGCHVFVEKPLAPTLAEARRLVDHAVAARRKLTVGYAPLFDPPALAMRELVARGVLGAPVHVESFFGYSLSGPYGAAVLADPLHWVHDLPGKLLQNNLDHVLNKLVEFLDDDAPRIHVAAYRRHEARFSDRRDDLLDELRVLVAGERTSAYATFSAHARPASHFARIYGTRNTLHVDYVARTVALEREPAPLGALGRAVLPFAHAKQQIFAGFSNLARFARSDFHYFAGLRHLLGRFYACIAEDTPPPIPYRDILRVAAMIDEIVRQLPAASRT